MFIKCGPANSAEYYNKNILLQFLHTSNICLRTLQVFLIVILCFLFCLIFNADLSRFFEHNVQ